MSVVCMYFVALRELPKRKPIVWLLCPVPNFLKHFNSIWINTSRIFRTVKTSLGIRYAWIAKNRLFFRKKGFLFPLWIKVLSRWNRWFIRWGGFLFLHISTAQGIALS